MCSVQTPRFSQKSRSWTVSFSSFYVHVYNSLKKTSPNHCKTALDKPNQTYSYTWHSPSQCVEVAFVLRSSTELRHWMGVLCHSEEVGNTCSPWALLLPDLSHSTSQWPSACLPSCQATLSQTGCKHTDNVLRKLGRERNEREERDRKRKRYR